MSLIANFPARFTFTNPDGTLTPEAARMLREWFARIGGSNATDLTAVISLLAGLTISVNDDKIDASFSDASAAFAELAKATEARDDYQDVSGIAELRKDIEDLKAQFSGTPAQLAELEKAVNSQAVEIAMVPGLPAPSLPLGAVSNFYVYKTALQAIGAAAYTAVNFDTALFDDLGEFNVATGTFTAAHAGFYVFAGGIEGQQGAVTRRILGVFVNAAERVRLQDGTGHTGTCMIGGASAPIKLAAGDAVRLYYYTGIAENTLFSQQTTYFGGYRIK